MCNRLHSKHERLALLVSTNQGLRPDTLPLPTVRILSPSLPQQTEYASPAKHWPPSASRSPPEPIKSRCLLSQRWGETPLRPFMPVQSPASPNGEACSTQEAEQLRPASIAIVSWTPTTYLKTTSLSMWRPCHVQGLPLPGSCDVEAPLVLEHRSTSAHSLPYWPLGKTFQPQQ